ncbi:class I SAM-dependent methyltransferase [Microvirga sp. VF16]|uniref:class I SAM-dependent methyltransferase n=1 Tax=Microvirga sp. VF16 TaxID=2807101 RepID=UPI00193D94F9|nr:class I SAM-dependent methyltransferase [Microvirga sp. VF16]QRM31610.1 class I SAM-dependent methyltransferase [Microvirga sp. VF16]
MTGARSEHWDKVFTTKVENEVSWFQPRPETSLRLIHACNLRKDACILDVGAGVSHLPDVLLAEGLNNVVLLDVSAAALERLKVRLGGDGRSVRFIVADITTWEPDLVVDLWHDRAVLHFLTESGDRAAYAEALRHSVKMGGFVIISGFALGGPERCSGLPVLRAGQDDIAALLGPDFDLLEAFEEDHQTPSGGRQRFVFTRFHRRLV